MRQIDKQSAGTDEWGNPEGAGMGVRERNTKSQKDPNLAWWGGLPNSCSRVVKQPHFLTSTLGLHTPARVSPSMLACASLEVQISLHSCQTLATAMRSQLSVSHTVGPHRKERGEGWALGGFCWPHGQPVGLGATQCQGING